MFKRGDIVWGKMKTFPWWPAIVLNPKDCGRDKVGKNKLWLFWFGDHKVTQVEFSQVLDFRKHFGEKCVPKMAKALKSAIQEVLTILTARCNIKISDPSSLFEWAKKVFQSKLPLPSDNLNSFDLPDVVKTALQKKAFKRKLESTLEENNETLQEVTEDEIVTILDFVSKSLITLEEICVMCCKLDNSLVMRHPFFVGGVCQDCRKLITKIMKCSKGQIHDICILCGLGGNLVYCCNKLCMSAYCETCIDYMTPKETLSKILENNNWHCYLCEPKPDGKSLIKKREIYLPVNSPASPTEKSPIRVMGLTNAALLVLKKKNIDVDLSNTNESSDAKEIEDICPDFIYGSFFVLSTAVDIKESQQSLFVDYYKFLFMLLIARVSKPHVFFMYICDGEILNPFIMQRVKRFLQVDPTQIMLGTKTIYLWSNLPAIKGINENKYLMKKSKDSKFIEETILEKFFEPLKIFYKHK